MLEEIDYTKTTYEYKSDTFVNSFSGKPEEKTNNADNRVVPQTQICGDDCSLRESILLSDMSSVVLEKLVSHENT
jgi:hypothetical protein